MVGEGRKPSRAAALLGTLLLLVVVGGCIRLGFWQLDRLAQRRVLNSRITERQQAPALAGAGALADTAGTLHRLVQLTGRYDDARSIVLPGRSLHGVPGVHLLTPLLLGPDEAVLVNRGWLPAADGATVPWDSFPAAGVGSAAGDAHLTGLVLPFPGTARSAAPPSPGDSGFRRVWYRLDARMLQAQYPYRLLPVELRLLPGQTTSKYPVPLAPPVLDEGPHLSYALQWFSFAAIGAIGWLALARRGRQRGTRPESPRPAGLATSSNQQQ